MQHLDLSNNYFDLAQSKVIAEALEKNHSMYGFHFSGNHGYVDSRMFIVIKENRGQLPPPLTGMNTKRRIDGIFYLFIYKLFSLKKHTQNI